MLLELQLTHPAKIKEKIVKLLNDFKKSVNKKIDNKSIKMVPYLKM